jgi:hypothetical protein
MDGWNIPFASYVKFLGVIVDDYMETAHRNE